MITNEGIERVRRWGWKVVPGMQEYGGRARIYVARGGITLAFFADQDDKDLVRQCGRMMIGIGPRFRLRQREMAADTAYPRDSVHSKE